MTLADIGGGHLAGFHYAHVPARTGDPGWTAVGFHGTGGDEYAMLGFLGDLTAAPVLSPRGRVPEGGANRFFRRYAEGVFDEKNIRGEAEALRGFLAQAAEAHGLAGRRLVAVGYSNGANIAAAMMLLFPGVFAGAVLLRPMMMFADAPAAGAAPSRVLALSGERDPICPPESARRLAAALEAAGAELDHRWFPTGHQLTGGDQDAALRWLRGFA
ncbi:MAG: dienelactone hydrolase family protein [Candidatus Sumerlaeia bacterium]|nr:dienelactone hydrolase family protein [Candidatus Sumerlaeia bacterium]